MSIRIPCLEKAAEQIAEGHWPEAVAESGRSVVAVVCNLAPLELIHASGATPVRLCAGEAGPLPEGVPEPPRQMCPVVKGAAARLGALRRQVGERLVAVVIPGTCDWKARYGDFLGLGDGALVLDVPRDKSSWEARQAWRRQIAALADYLGRRTGAPATRASLLRSIALYQQATALGRRLTEQMKQAPPPMSGSDLMRVFNLFYSLPIEVWIEAAGALLAGIGMDGMDGADKLDKVDGGAGGAKGPRILVVGAPIIWPHWQVPRLIESLGGRIVADALCSSYRGFSDLVSVDETTRTGLLDALADRYLLPCTCPCFGSDEEYLWRVENQTRDFRIEGAVIHRLKSCYLYDLEADRLEGLFRRLGLPCLQIEDDYESPAPAGLATRIEAFLDMVRSRKAGV
ncbi:MAG: 2-hydroxyacyl-CoA dehydratase family protein [Candidatus Sumerlaeia bacterium]|nr:2-hydroxyacyl-CoA dehydratase family protein [Candidatus Sumerlaeia bacterium]